MWIIQFSIRNPVTTVVAVLMVALFGSLSLRTIPIQMTPTVDKPEISITTAYPGAAPQEVEEQITIPIEEKLQAVEGLKRLTSSSTEGNSRVELEFEWGVNKDIALIDIIKRLSTVRQLPDDAEEPVIFAGTSSERRPVYWASMRGTMPVDKMRLLAEDFIQPRFERIEGVGEVRVYGGEEREIRVVIDFRALSGRNLNVKDVLAALQRENMNVRGGHIDQGKRRYLVRTVGLFEDIRDVEAVIIKKDETGAPVYVRDVAKVYDTFKERRSMVRIMGEPSVAFGIVKKSGSNTIQVVNKVEATIERLNRELESRGVAIHENYDSTDYIWESIDFVASNMGYGALLAILVLIVFLKSFRSTLIIGIAIPIVIVSGFILLNVFGRTINIVSLAGMAFAIGMVVDNAIVVLENIYRHLQEGKDKVSAALDGTVEVWGAVLASTLTTLAVFVPIIFVKEEAGQLFKDIAIAISCSVFVSLVVSMTVIPMLAARFLEVGTLLKGGAGRKTFDLFMLDRFGRLVIRFFMGTVRWLSSASLVKKAAVIALIVAAASATLPLTPKMEYLPLGNRNLIFTVFKPYVGSNMETTQKHSDEVAEKILALPEVKYIFHVVSDRFMGIGVRVKDEYRLRIGEVTQKINGAIQGTPGFKHAMAFQTPLFARVLGSEMEIELRGLDLDRINEVSEQVQKQLFGKEGMLFVRSNLETGSPEYQIYIDREKAADLSLSVRDVAEVVETLVAGKKATLYKTGGEEYDITVKGLAEAFTNRHSLEDILIYGDDGIPIRLDSIARVVETTGPTQINHIEMDRAVTLSVSKAPGTPLQAMVESINKDVLDPVRQALDYGYSISISGAASDLEQTAMALSGSFALAVIIVYLVMASLFESFLYPLLIMFAVPLAASGAILGVVATGSNLDVLTMLGFIILTGIVVNNAILLIHQARLNMHESGMGRVEAIQEAVKYRLRPIFMSTITTVFGLAPLVVRSGAGSELYSGLASAISGGLAMSTLFTLVLVPALYLFVADIRAKTASKL